MAGCWGSKREMMEWLFRDVWGRIDGVSEKGMVMAKDEWDGEEDITSGMERCNYCFAFCSVTTG